ncbi:MAG: hypothetical protein JW757_07285 [Anaerolineales bacterium]|nr:hypothetical protein [Anaerolineales bacterium]
MIASFLDILTIIFSIVTLVLTVRMLSSYTKPKKFNLSSIFSSIALSVVTLVVFILVSGAKLNLVLAVVLFILGGLWGLIRGLTIKMYPLEGEVIVRNSALSLIGFGGSMALSSLMNSFDSALLAALGLVPLCMSTGVTVAIKVTVLLRRLLMGKIV